MDLKSIREMNNLTQQQLADSIGKDRSLIAKIESGVAFPSVETAKAIGSKLKFDWTLFFENAREETSHERGEINVRND